MDKTFCKKTFEIKYREGGNNYRLIATAELHSLSGQYPYFSVTGELLRQTNGRGRFAWESGGCLHDDISKHFPKLRKFIKWHLVSTDKPLHYVANSLYWAGLQGWTEGKKDSPPNYEYLVSTAKWGTIPGDEKINLRLFMGRGSKKNVINRIKAYFLAKILNKRLERLQSEFYSAMTELFDEPDVRAAFEFEGN